MRCIEKGCAFPAASNSQRCRGHQYLDKEKDDIKNEEKEEKADLGTWKIIDKADVPRFKVVNQEAYRVAISASKLEAKHALQGKFKKTKKEMTSLAVAIVNYGKKMGFKLTYRIADDTIYIVKEPNASRCSNSAS